jgi:hypothetical protein
MRIIRRKKESQLGLAILGFALGAASGGAIAIGAVAIGAVAVGQFSARRGRIDKLHIKELTVDTLIVKEQATPPASV